MTLYAPLAPQRAVTYAEQMLTDLLRWQAEDPATGRRVVELIELATRSPKRGRGRPKRLGSLPGLWSRRITQHHRLFYRIEDGDLRFLQCWGHDLPEHVYDEIRQESA